MVKVIALSDTHGLHKKVNLPAGQILIHAGDWTASSDYASIREFLIWYEARPHQHKVLIAGNHETYVQANPEAFAGLLSDYAPSVIYLNDQSVELEGLKIHGSAWSPAFLNWAFNAERGPEIQAHWDMIPSDVDVLVTHGPAMGILDYIDGWDGPRQHVGCANLATTIQERLKTLRCHIGGHVHGPGGKTQMSHGVLHVNASVVNEGYNLTNQPVEINL